MEVSLCVVLVGYMLKLSGFNQKAIQQLPEVLTNLKWCAYLPNILFAVLALILAIKFPITEAFMTQVHEKLNQRRAQRDQP
jgi:Na+/melibiose symporter-like transporter